ncbi:MAG: hypothetical protein RSF70_09030 [Ruthenibacterium sp.]
MKNFLKHTLEWKISTCLVFTASVIFAMLITFCFGGKSLSLLTLFALMLMSMYGAFLQAALFSDWIFHRLSYTLRILLFVAFYLPILMLCGIFCKWFPLGNPLGWLIFCGVFMLIFVGMTVGFEVYYRVQGKKYDGLLGQYRKQKEDWK